MTRDWHSSALVFIGATVSLGLLFGAWYCDVTAIRPISQSLEEGLHAHLAPPEALCRVVVLGVNQTRGHVAFGVNCSDTLNVTDRISGFSVDASRLQLANLLEALHVLDVAIMAFEVLAGGCSAIGYVLGAVLLLRGRRIS
jgi:hypothetical protein